MSQENRRMRRALVNIDTDVAKYLWYRDDSQRRFDERCEADQRHEQSLNDAGVVLTPALRRKISDLEEQCMNEINGFEDDPAQHSS